MFLKNAFCCQWLIENLLKIEMKNLRNEAKQIYQLSMVTHKVVSGFAAYLGLQRRGAVKAESGRSMWLVSCILLCGS